MHAGYFAVAIDGFCPLIRRFWMFQLHVRMHTLLTFMYSRVVQPSNFNPAHDGWCYSDDRETHVSTVWPLKDTV